MTDDFISLGYLSINLSEFILKMIVDLFILIRFTMSMNFSFFLNLLNTTLQIRDANNIFLFCSNDFLMLFDDGDGIHGLLNFMYHFI